MICKNLTDVLSDLSDLSTVNEAIENIQVVEGIEYVMDSESFTSPPHVRTPAMFNKLHSVCSRSCMSPSRDRANIEYLSAIIVMR